MESNHPTTINDLPDEILQHIMRYLPSESRKTDRSNLLQVSKKFRTIADSSIALDVFIGSSSWNTLDSNNTIHTIDISRIQDIGISSCHVGELMELQQLPSGVVGFFAGVFGKVKSLFSPPPFPSFKHPHLLQTLRFSGIIRDDFFHGLLTSITAANITKLYLNHSALSLILPHSLQNLRFRRLKYLEVLADFTYIFREIDDSNILGNVLWLLSNQFPRLRATKVYLPYKASQEYKITKTLFNLILSSSRYLKFIELCYFNMFFDDDDDDEEAFNPTSWNFAVLDALAVEAGSSAQLKAIILHVNVDILYCYRTWLKFLAEQTTVECYIVLSDRQFINRSFLMQNATTLQVLLAAIETLGDDGLPKPLDCEIFSSSNALTHFTLKGRYLDYTTMDAFPGIVNTAVLPSSIQQVDLSRIPIVTEDLLFIVELPNLKYFVGKFIGKFGQMGANQQLLTRVIQRRQIQWFHLLESVNGLFPVAGIPNGDPVEPQMLHMENDSFCIKLNPRGYYVTASVMEEIFNHLNLISQRHLLN